jgi:hypothetical protein
MSLNTALCKVGLAFLIRGVEGTSAADCSAIGRRCGVGLSWVRLLGWGRWRLRAMRFKEIRPSAGAIRRVE